jgi:hypothetical protein
MTLWMVTSANAGEAKQMATVVARTYFIVGLLAAVNPATSDYARQRAQSPHEP